MVDEQAAKPLHRVKNILPGLLNQSLPENRAKRTHIPAQGIVFRGIIRASRDFGQQSLLVLGLPQRFSARRHEREETEYI
jgi:hypothetical protein